MPEKPQPPEERPRQYQHAVTCSGDRTKPPGTRGFSCSCRIIPESEDRIASVDEASDYLYERLGAESLAGKCVTLLRAYIVTARAEGLQQGKRERDILQKALDDLEKSGDCG